MKLCVRSGYNLPPISLTSLADIAGMAGVGTRSLTAVLVNVVPKGEVVAGENSRGVRSLEEEVDVVDLVEFGHALLVVVVVLLMLVSIVKDVFFVCAMSFFFFIGRGVYRSIIPDDDDEESSESMSIGASPLGLTDAAAFICTFL